MFVKNLLAMFQDILYPLRCLGCLKDGESLCESCLAAVPPDLIEPLAVGHLDKLIASTNYRDVNLYVQMFKYQFVTVLAGPLAELMLRRLSGLGDFAGFVLCPVPLHSRRLRERGFNQSELLCQELAVRLGLSVGQFLTRDHYTKHQAQLNRAERLINLKGKFGVKSSVAGLKVLLVDDVYTTGATLQECAQVLKNAGAAQVWGLVLARD